MACAALGCMAVRTALARHAHATLTAATYMRPSPECALMQCVHHATLAAAPCIATATAIVTGAAAVVCGIAWWPLLAHTRPRAWLCSCPDVGAGSSCVLASVAAVAHCMAACLPHAVPHLTWLCKCGAGWWWPVAVDSWIANIALLGDGPAFLEDLNTCVPG